MSLRSRMHGMSLIEMLAGLAVAGIVSAVVTVSLAASGVAARSHFKTVREEDAVRQALAIMAYDLAQAPSWQMCTEARDCGKRSRRSYRVNLLQAGDVDWLFDHELRRCRGQCNAVVEGVAGFEVVADMEAGDGTVIREPLQQRHGERARLVEVTLVLADGRRFSRSVARRPAGSQKSS